MIKHTPSGVHHGRNVKRFRNLRNVKQDALALSLGDDWTQKKISALENEAVIEEELLDKIARILNVETDAIKNFREEQTITNNQYNYEGSHVSAPNGGPNENVSVIYNPIEELVAAYKKNQELSEQLIKAKDDKIAVLEKMLKNLEGGK